MMPDSVFHRVAEPWQKLDKAEERIGRGRGWGQAQQTQLLHSCHVKLWQEVCKHCIVLSICPRLCRQYPIPEPWGSAWAGREEILVLKSEMRCLPRLKLHTKPYHRLPLLIYHPHLLNICCHVLHDSSVMVSPNTCPYPLALLSCIF